MSVLFMALIVSLLGVALALNFDPITTEREGEQ